MYLKFEEVALISDKSKLSPHDPVIYERILRGERILTLDDNPIPQATEAAPYGRLYFDVHDNPCIVPETQEQFEADRMSAKTWR